MREDSLVILLKGLFTHFKDWGFLEDLKSDFYVDFYNYLVKDLDLDNELKANNIKEVKDLINILED